MPFYNRIWPKNDPFWQTNQPGTLWNCKCDWEETDEGPTSDNPTSRIVKPGLDKNPATSGQIFTDTAPYIRRYSKTKEGDSPEQDCRKANRNHAAKVGREVNKNKHVYTEIDGVPHEFDFSNFRYMHDDKSEKVDICKHFSASLFGHQSYWLKNEVLFDPQTYLDKAHFLMSADVDAHNTGIATVALKDATDKFFYYSLQLADGNSIILHVGRYRKSHKLYLYAATEKIPKYVQNPR